jgi:hypothetical protein
LPPESLHGGAAERKVVARNEAATNRCAEESTNGVVKERSAWSLYTAVIYGT